MGKRDELFKLEGEDDHNDSLSAYSLLPDCEQISVILNVIT